MIQKALFWDFDGTLIHPNESFLFGLKHALESYQYRINIEDSRAFLHSVCSWYTPEITYADRTGTRWWDDLFHNYDTFYDHHGITKTNRQKINKIFKDYILNFRNYVLYHDAMEILHQCKAMGYNNYILSNNFPELPAIIEKIGLSEYFTDYIISSNIGFEKPRTEIFQYALHIAHYPNLCYMIGDNPIADIQGGKDAGMKTILIHHKALLESNDDNLSCENLIDIIKIIH